MKHFKLFIISLFLVFGYLILISYPYFFSKITRFDSLGPLSLVEEKSVNIQKTFSPDRRTDQFDNHLLKGEKVTVKLKASENNFGILLFRFAQLSDNVTDTVVFRVKEEGKEWHYENNYKANQFQPDQYFTFGFPPFKNSKNNTYVFEIESLSGTYKNGIGVSLREPQVALVYKYTRADLTNFNTLFPFIFKKFVYVARNVNFLQDRQLFIIFFSSFLFTLYLKNKRKIKLPKPKKKYRKFLKMVVGEIIFDYVLFEKKLFKPLKKSVLRFTRSKFYLKYLDTNAKKRLAIVLLVFLIAILYRFSAASVDQLGVFSFYAGLGGQGDYDQFIRAATCAVRNFCPAILGQNFLIESSILGTFYEIFGFAGGLKAYLYFMIILSSIVATLPYVLLSRKHFITIGGIIGSLFLATSDYLTHMALNLPPDNASLFAFSMFFIVYLITIHIGTIRWLLFFGLIGLIDGLNKLLLLINDLAVFMLFVPVFFYEKANKTKKFPFVKLNPKLIFYSILPLLVFLVIYSAWEYVVQMKFSTPYYLRALIEGGSTYQSSTDAGSMSINESLSQGNILEKLFYYAGLSVVMLKRVIQNAGLNDIFLIPILFGLLFATFRKSPFDGFDKLTTSNLRARKFSVTKLISMVIFASLAFTTLQLFKENFLGIQDIGQYVYAWSNDIYVNVFLFASIIFLFILNFRYQAFKLALPIVPYVIMLIILTKNAPWERLLAHVIVWSIILFSFLIDWILSNTKKNLPALPAGRQGGRHGYALKRLWIGPILLVLFIFFYTIPKTSSMVAQLRSGINNTRGEVEYLKWVNSELPKNAIILAGGKSDLVTVTENINRPIIYNTLWTAALLIIPNEIPGAKPTDFAILNQLKINEIPGVSPSDFSIIRELRNKDNFGKNKYMILEDDVYIWRDRVAGVGDNLFSTSSAALLNGEDYLIKVYKSNPILKKAIYELKLK